MKKFEVFSRKVFLEKYVAPCRIRERRNTILLHASLRQCMHARASVHASIQVSTLHFHECMHAQCMPAVEMRGDSAGPGPGPQGRAKLHVSFATGPVR